mmetsp:Transcript_172654/g.553299  ORF Transcript_172654/g.553299 Transcript_172654/m.553299 type:complete len:497 (+) Transcript_172654:479-1969(+)
MQALRRNSLLHVRMLQALGRKGTRSAAEHGLPGVGARRAHWPGRLQCVLGHRGASGRLGPRPITPGRQGCLCRPRWLRPPRAHAGAGAHCPNAATNATAATEALTRRRTPNRARRALPARRRRPGGAEAGAGRARGRCEGVALTLRGAAGGAARARGRFLRRQPAKTILLVQPLDALILSSGAQTLPRLVEAPGHRRGGEPGRGGAVELVHALEATAALRCVGPEGAALHLGAALLALHLLNPRLLALPLSHGAGIEHLCPGGATRRGNLSLQFPRPRRCLRSECAAAHLAFRRLRPPLLLLRLRLAVAPQHQICMRLDCLLRCRRHLSLDELLCQNAALWVNIWAHHLNVRALHLCLLILLVVIHALHIQGLKLSADTLRLEAQQQLHDAAVRRELARRLREAPARVRRAARAATRSGLVTLGDGRQRGGRRRRAGLRIACCTRPSSSWRLNPLTGLRVVGTEAIDCPHQDMEKHRQTEQIDLPLALRIQMLPDG